MMMKNKRFHVTARLGLEAAAYLKQVRKDFSSRSEALEHLLIIGGSSYIRGLRVKEQLKGSTGTILSKGMPCIHSKWFEHLDKRLLSIENTTATADHLNRNCYLLSKEIKKSKERE